MFFRFIKIVILVIGIAHGQNFQFQEESPGAYLTRGPLIISSTGEVISIKHPSTGDITLMLKGIKKYIASPDGSGILILNFGFLPGKSDYTIDYFYATEQNGLLFRESRIAPFDLPHPKFSIDDLGHIYIFDPMTLSLSLTGIRGSSKIKIIEEVPFVMEKTFFLKSGTDFVVGVSNIEARSDEADNIVVFKFSPSIGIVQKSMLEGSTVSALSVDISGIIVSTISEHSAEISEKTVQLADDFSSSITLPAQISQKLTLGGKEIFIGRNEIKINSPDDQVKIVTLGTGQTANSVWLLNSAAVLIKVQSGTSSDLMILNEQEKFEPRNSGITLQDNSRYDMFISEDTIFLIEDYKRTLIYSIQ